MSKSDINLRGFGPQQGRTQGLKDEAEMDMCDLTPKNKNRGRGIWASSSNDVLSRSLEVPPQEVKSKFCKSTVFVFA